MSLVSNVLMAQLPTIFSCTPKEKEPSALEKAFEVKEEERIPTLAPSEYTIVDSKLYIDGKKTYMVWIDTYRDPADKEKLIGFNMGCGIYNAGSDLVGSLMLPKDGIRDVGLCTIGREIYGRPIIAKLFIEIRDSKGNKIGTQYEVNKPTEMGEYSGWIEDTNGKIIAVRQSWGCSVVYHKQDPADSLGLSYKIEKIVKEAAGKHRSN